MAYIKRQTSSDGGNIVTDDSLLVVKAFYPPSGETPSLNEFDSTKPALFIDTSTGRLNLYDPETSSWIPYAKLSDAGGVSAPTFESFTYTSGAQSFTLNQEVDFGYYVSVNGILLDPVEGFYSFDGSILTISEEEVLEEGDKILVCYVGSGSTPSFWNDLNTWNDSNTWND